MEYKDTLLMPNTDFEMKANLPEKEKNIQDFWVKNSIYQKVLNKNLHNKPFVLHDGPPYANGSLHLGHALNKILKDIIVRHKAISGFYTPFVMGWDTHGLPIENKMLNEKGMTKDDLDKILLRKEAAKYALSQVEHQKNQFRKFSLFTDFDNYYVTLDKKYEAAQLRIFKKLVLEKTIYKNLKPVFWSPSSQSALAEAEVEYQEHRSPQIIVGFNVLDSKVLPTKSQLLIMTTTPWTLVANSGVAVGKDIEYVLVQVNNLLLVVAKELCQTMFELLNYSEYKIIKTFKGEELIGTTYQCPIKKSLIGKVVSGHHVKTDTGTGLVHMAPLFGEDDYIIGKENNLEMIMHVDDRGYFTTDADEYNGMFYEDASKAIGQKLESENVLYSLKFIKHSYPFDWRTHKPIIFRGVPQWFLNINNYKTKIVSELENVKSHPEWGVKRLTEMVSQRNEWTISRQRTWGVPLIIFYDKNGQVVLEEEVFDYVIDLVENYGSDIWFEREVDELLPEKYRNLGWTKENDIMDVWFDSGSSSVAVKPNGLGAPFDLYLEGSDQFRGWFNSSLINSVAYNGFSPYKSFITHGFVLDGKMEKMSKSKGNVVDPLLFVEKHGADILRLWVANSEYTSDVSVSDTIISQVVEIYRNIRNKIKFMLGNISDFDVNQRVELKNDHALVNEQFQNLIYGVNLAYSEYRFVDVVKQINKFLIDQSGFYFEYSKDTLYCDDKNSYERRAVQTNIYNMLEFLILALSPIIPTTCEEMYSFFKKTNHQESIFMEDYKFIGNQSKALQTQWQEFFVLKDEIYRLIENSKKDQLIKRNNEVKVVVNTSSEFLKSLNLQKLLMVAEVEFGNVTKLEIMESVKCKRCWNHFQTQNMSNEDLCKRCFNVLNN